MWGMDNFHVKDADATLDTTTGGGSHFHVTKACFDPFCDILAVSRPCDRAANSHFSLSPVATFCVLGCRHPVRLHRRRVARRLTATTSPRAPRRTRQPRR